MSNFILLGVCLVIGILLKATRRLPKEAPQVLNGFIFYVSLPALVVSQFHQISLSREAILPVVSTWLIFLMSALIFSFYGKKFKLDQKTIGALTLTAGLGNTAFVGFPLIEAFYGRGGLKTALLVDQLGTFPTVSTLGVIVASYYSSGQFSLKKMIHRIFKFPPTYALLLAFFTRPLHFPIELQTVMTRLGDTLTPIAVVSVGFQLNFKASIIGRNARNLFSGLTYKLCLGPAIIAFIYMGLLKREGEAIEITVLESAMAPMITAAIVAAEYELNTEIANLMVGLGIPLSLITVPLFWKML